jgi:hypothetical protein
MVTVVGTTVTLVVAVDKDGPTAIVAVAMIDTLMLALGMEVGAT